jgi:hypothetical protein
MNCDLSDETLHLAFVTSVGGFLGLWKQGPGLVEMPFNLCLQTGRGNRPSKGGPMVDFPGMVHGMLGFVHKLKIVGMWMSEPINRPRHPRDCANHRTE